MTDDYPMVSVLVPAFNTGEYLEKCINSILLQSYKNIEIIIVDDGSTDETWNICNNLQALHHNVFAYRQDNKGALEARNYALKKASGEYIVWVDSDDYIEDDYIEALVQTMICDQSDIVCCQLTYSIGDDDRKISGTIPPGIYNTEQIKNGVLFSGVFFEHGILPHGVTKLYKRSLLEKFTFSVDPDIRIGEDAAVIYPYILNCNKVSIIDTYGYHYIQRQTSAMKAVGNNNVEGVKKLTSYLRKWFSEDKTIQNQIDLYSNYLMMLKNIAYFDKANLLGLYGGIKKNSKLIIYGAGGFGQNIYNYCIGHRVDVVAWIDKNSLYYKQQGLNVISLEECKRLNIDYDYLVVAVLNEKISDAIIVDLIQEKMDRKKIIYISPQYISLEKGNL
ncbi:Glycosyl transferase family 2 [Butyrivibrio proteoclasticus]|uniref:Glycosyl transferase family 2 n=1 Tax=Butyrivibrio proteoclasticus TaxID=43305 RepID=A0A1I5VWK4_9FIRM|nr:glycosyltransferase [Butyrivibrio proteoclasticus]SFQ11793.1 Glycosyl transferase family 2 [Butyrivibrio proteoclasticus]